MRHIFTMLEDFRKALNPPYSKKDISPILLTILILILIPVTIMILRGQSIFNSNASGISSLEAEAATKDSQVTAGTDATASNNSYIEFHLSGVTPTPITGRSYYVDCAAGNDANAGTSQASPWQSISKAASAPLLPGDGMFFKRDCSWNGVLTLSKSGTASSPITVGAYGTGANLPTITRNTNGADISVTGSYITFENLRLTATAPSVESGCGNNPKGNTQGFSFESNSHDNTVRNSFMSGHYAGVYIKSGSSKNHILNNTFQNNNMMSPLDTASNNDAGAFAVLLWGDDNEIAYNTMTGSDACSYDYQRDGSAVELYGGQRNNIHHNTAANDDAFAELGNSRSSDNTFSYNKFTSTSTHSLFLVTRGSSDSYGPVLHTTVNNNSIYLPKSFKDAIVCYAGCDSTIIKLRNNISWGGAGALYSDKAIDEDYNLFMGAVHINGGSTVGSHSLKADPKFVNAGAGDLHLQSTSPAINKGLDIGFTTDLDNKVVPNGTAPDMGAFEF
jgi:hypothetical protein